MLKNIMKRKKSCMKYLIHDILEYEIIELRLMEITICIQIISKTSYIDNNSMQHPKVFVVSIFQARRKRMQ